MFGVVSQEARGHVVTTVLIAMVAMLLTAVSYGRMARVYPSAGSAFAYVSGEFGGTAGFFTGWSVLLEYLLNPLVCTIWCSSAAANFVPLIPPAVWNVFFATLFTVLNLRGVDPPERLQWLAIILGAVVLWLLACMVRYLLLQGPHGPAFYTRPFYDRPRFSFPAFPPAFPSPRSPSSVLTASTLSGKPSTHTATSCAPPSSVPFHRRARGRQCYLGRWSGPISASTPT
jgi:amino acid transporter